MIEKEFDSLDWLELPSIPDKVYNPLLDYPIGGIPDDPAEELVKFFSDIRYIHFAVKEILNMELLPFQCAILDRLWTKRLPMMIMSRGGGKSTLLAVYTLLRLIFHPGCKVVLVGGAFRQAKQIHEYMVNIWEKAPILQDIARIRKQSGPYKEPDRYGFRIGDSVAISIPLGPDGSKIRGLRANYILADEFSSISEEIFNVVIQGFGIVAADPVSKVKEAALVKRLKQNGLWTTEMQELRNKTLGGNQIVYSGSAYYAFGHFCKYFNKWRGIISSKGSETKLRESFGDDVLMEGFDWRDYCVMRVPYNQVPNGLLDPKILAQAKATLTTNQFLMEYGAIFPKDSDGFYKRSIIELATTNKPVLTMSGKSVQFGISKEGDIKRKYWIGVDPAADQDNAAIVVIEIHEDHRRVVLCWTTNKKKFAKYKKYLENNGTPLEIGYYHYIARKIRSIMRSFNTERIIMDKHGGGTAIAEALCHEDTYDEGEYPVFELMDPEDPKPNDIKNGLHILQMISATSEINSQANHGLLKDLQDKVVLFPMFDPVEIEKAVYVDANEENPDFDTYEDLLFEIEELKNEMTSIVLTATSILGQERFDTPDVKSSSSAKKGRLRKDRYSALLYVNHYYRTRNSSDPVVMPYNPVGRVKGQNIIKVNADQSLYSGLGTARFQGSSWVKSGNPRFIKRKD